MTTPNGSEGGAGGAGAAGAAGSANGGQAGAGAAGAAGAQAVEYKFSKVEGVEVPEAFDADVAATAKEMGWDLPTAEKYRSLEIKRAQAELAADKKLTEESTAAAKIKAEQDALQRKQAHEKANRDDPEFGGAKYAETTQRVEQMIAMAGERGKALMKEMGESAPAMLANPAFRAFLAHFAYKMADASFHQGANGHQDAPKTFADVAYGDKYPAAAR